MIWNEPILPGNIINYMFFIDHKFVIIDFKLSLYIVRVEWMVEWMKNQSIKYKFILYLLQFQYINVFLYVLLFRKDTHLDVHSHNHIYNMTYAVCSTHNHKTPRIYQLDICICTHTYCTVLVLIWIVIELDY